MKEKKLVMRRTKSYETVFVPSTPPPKKKKLNESHPFPRGGAVVAKSNVDNSQIINKQSVRVVSSLSAASYIRDFREFFANTSKTFCYVQYNFKDCDIRIQFILKNLGYF